MRAEISLPSLERQDLGSKYNRPYCGEDKISQIYRPTKARDFEGPGGPETKQALYEEANPGNDDVGSNVR